MKILQAASEGVPFCKTGGLADVVGAVSLALARSGHSVQLVLPLYSQIDRAKFKLVKTNKLLYVPSPEGFDPISIWTKSLHKNLKVYFIQSERYFNRKGFYGDRPDEAYIDNDRRFVVFSRAVLELAKANKFSPDVVHAHDWQTGLIPAYLKCLYKNDPFFQSTGSLFTIHNMAFQGVFPNSSFAATGLPFSEFNPGGIEFYDHISFLKAGLVYSDAINTVSPTYATEIQSDPIYGHGLEGVLQDRSEQFRGILNGLDTTVWNPSTDRFLAQKFSVKTLALRKKCKADLQRYCEFRVSDKIPLFGYVGRLDYQKGVDYLLDVIPALIQNEAHVVILGRGELEYERALRVLQLKHPDYFFYENKFAEPLAHKIAAGSDIFLMPSRYEPCGLSQLIAMRYGSIPVVTPTGGLLDTVIDLNTDSDGTGFIASNKLSSEFLRCVFHALNMWGRKKKWAAVQSRAMSQDFSWGSPIRAYVNLYQNAVRWRQADNG